MGFKFRLEKVLHHRKSLEDSARKSFLEAKAALNEAESVLQSFLQSIQDSQNERLTIIRSSGNQSERLRQIADYIKGTEIKIDRQKALINKQLAIVEERQRALQEASVEYKMVDKLKERQQLLYRENEKKLEQKEQNEIANSRFELRKKEEET